MSELEEVKRVLHHVRNDTEFQPHEFLIDDLKVDWLIEQAGKFEDQQKQIDSLGEFIQAIDIITMESGALPRIYKMLDAYFNRV